MTKIPSVCRFRAYFYRTPAGNQPVLDWLKGQSRMDRFVLGKDIAKVEAGGPTIGKPTVDGLGNGLYEIRSTISNGNVEARIVFGVAGNHLVLLHAFTKASKTTPKRDIATAQTRWAEARRSKQP